MYTAKFAQWNALHIHQIEAGLTEITAIYYLWLIINDQFPLYKCPLMETTCKYNMENYFKDCTLW